MRPEVGYPIIFFIQFRAGASGIQIPGFNAPILRGRVKSKLTESKTVDEDYYENMRKKREEMRGVKFDYRLSPMLRGYSGRKIAGRQMGAPPSTEDRKPRSRFRNYEILLSFSVKL